MNSRTLICAYGKCSSVESIFERLFTMYLSNNSRNYCYGAIIDLPDSVCYRSAHDFLKEEMAEKCMNYLSKNCDGSFFCSIRQRRYTSFGNGYIYTCHGGALGALKSLWSQVKGGKSDLFPIIGRIPTGVERVYFSCFGEDRPKEMQEGFICIEPSGVFKLGAALGERAAVFPIKAEKTWGNECGAFKRIISALSMRAQSPDGLYSAKCLDALLGIEGEVPLVFGSKIKGARLTYYPRLYTCQKDTQMGVLL